MRDPIRLKDMLGETAARSFAAEAASISSFAEDAALLEKMQGELMTSTVATAAATSTVITAGNKVAAGKLFSAAKAASVTQAAVATSKFVVAVKAGVGIAAVVGLGVLVSPSVAEKTPAGTNNAPMSTAVSADSETVRHDNDAAAVTTALSDGEPVLLETVLLKTEGLADGAQAMVPESSAAEEVLVKRAKSSSSKSRSLKKPKRVALLRSPAPKGAEPTTLTDEGSKASQEGAQGIALAEVKPSVPAESRLEKQLAVLKNARTLYGDGAYSSASRILKAFRHQWDDSPIDDEVRVLTLKIMSKVKDYSALESRATAWLPLAKTESIRRVMQRARGEARLKTGNCEAGARDLNAAGTSGARSRALEQSCNLKKE